MSWFKRPKDRTTFYSTALKVSFMTEEGANKKIEEGIKAALVKQRYKETYATLEKEIEAFRESYAPIGPRYKISENPAGGYKILERRTRFKSLEDLRNYDTNYGRIPLTIVQLKEFRPRASEEYVPLYETEPTRFGKTIRIFSTFDEAEYFLLRAASPDAYETHYDGEPLRRVRNTSNCENTR